MRNVLAVVIPAFKGRFLGRTLASLASQNDKRFTVYVGDDNSPDSIDFICQQYDSPLDLHYKKFEENLGSHSLIKQWNRCVAMSDEPWVWLLSDDDEVDANCVSCFYQFYEKDLSSNVARFDTQVIDEQNRVVRNNVSHPESEGSIAFVLNRMRGKRSSYVSEYLFRRSMFDRCAGFVDFPAAWCSDDASWVHFAGEQSITKIGNARVQWRASELNISSVSSPYAFAKVDASLRYIQWLTENVFISERATQQQREELMAQSKIWLFNLIWKLSPYFYTNERQYVINEMVSLYDNRAEASLKLMKSNIRFGLKKLRGLLLYPLRRL